jgi:hypothetical protein
MPDLHLQVGSFYEQLKEFCLTYPLQLDINEDNFLAHHPQARVRALSWKEPFATLMLYPYDKNETRKWHAKYKGWILMCRSKIAYDDAALLEIAGEKQYHRIVSLANEDNRFYSNKNEGQAMAIGRLVNSRPMKEEDADKCFVQYNRNLFVHEYEGVRSIEPFYWKGVQGFKKLYLSEIKKIIIR